MLQMVKTRSMLTVPVLSLLEATEGHLGARNVLLGVLEVLEESSGPILLPSPAFRVWHCAQRVLKRLAPFLWSPGRCLLAWDLNDDDAPEKQKAAMNGGTRRLMIEVLDSMTASP
jgi:hypothetical protein